MDIEGMDSADNYLWLTGSHSTKRKKSKGKGASKDLQRQATIKQDANRCLLTRIPRPGGEPNTPKRKSGSHLPAKRPGKGTSLWKL